MRSWQNVLLSLRKPLLAPSALLDANKAAVSDVGWQRMQKV